ncbi:GNAT family N-acetyltransferase [Flammeovirga sp. EKP202]|uniref:GNAT family N-acetyltransferase n=1 Tax=Flammeovirga sp. EKP202 TaxID=2770592 RepID=UPI00165F2155|nr:GNAT family N-acetyltransferase [Flammeovirga sp. EKP202]MBD0404404.1 GNAT family N-acetyltransferase [Flammeovirga sp. EKP202]
MDNYIINNLYELWEHIGTINNTVITSEDFTAVAVQDSDWPKRVFDLKDHDSALTKVIDLCKKGDIPEVLTVPKSNDLRSHTGLALLMTQQNMALELESFTAEATTPPNIQQVKTEEGAKAFAAIASKSFGYRVDHKVINTIVRQSSTTRLFLYQENQKSLGCGIVFFDAENHAGLHMIGTLPEGRGKGIGKSMTMHLLKEAKGHGSKIAVLHASKMGEPIYTKLGFQKYGEIETYRILKGE